MKRRIPSVITSVLACFTLSLSAQVELPYYSGFDNTAEIAGWPIFRAGENTLSPLNKQAGLFLTQR